MAGGRVLVERDGPIASVVLSSPGRMNALDKMLAGKQYLMGDDFSICLRGKYITCLLKLFS